MSDQTILAIDQGTTNTKAVLVDMSGAVIARASRSLSISYPRPAWVEQDPRAIWESVCETIDECLAGQEPKKLAAVAITNQRETVMLWERETGRPLGPAIVWQCHRTAPFCEELRARGLEPLLRERTGLTIDPMFSASKIRWLLDQVQNGGRRAQQGELCAGTMDSWVLWNLTGGTNHACDVTNASRTQLFNIRRLCWDQELLEIFGVPGPTLPLVKASSSIYGESSATGRLPGGIPIASLVGDSHAALFGHAGFRPGSVKATYGTGSSLMTPTRVPIVSERGLSTTLAWGRQDVTYALEGNIYVTGAAVQWVGELLGKDAHGIEELAGQVTDTQGVFLVPAFVGLGAPHWSETARGLITGLTRGTTAAHLALAAVQSIAFQIRDVFDVMADESQSALDVLLADGGASRNNLLMQFQADILGRPVVRNLSTDVSALGASYLAGLALGLWKSEAEVERLPRPTDRFEPRLALAKRDELYARWSDAVARTTLQNHSEKEA